MPKSKRETFYKLEFLRKKYGYTQEQFASFLGLKKTSYSHKINGRSPFKFVEMQIIKAAINKKAEKNGDPLLTIDDIFFD